MGKRGSKKPPLCTTRTIPFDGTRLRLVVVSDTHGSPHPDGLRLIAEQKPDAILHAGDIGPLTLLDQFQSVAPTIAVRGNIDGRTAELPDSITVSVGDAPLLKIWLTHIAIYGPKLRADCADRALTCGATMVVCGHSHVPFIGRDRGLSIFNPGSMGPRRFPLPITFGVLDLSADKLDLRHLDCETGLTWSP